MSNWEVKNKIIYPEDDIDRFSLKTRDEFELIYNLLNRLRNFGATSGTTSNTIAFEPRIDSASGKLFIRNADNTGDILLGTISEDFFGITPENIGAAKKLVGNKSEIPATADTYDFYYAVDEKKLYIFTGTGWAVALSLNFADFSNYADYCIARDEVDYSGKDKILRLDKNTGKANVDISGSAEKISGVPIEISSLANNHAIVFDSAKNKFVNKPKDEITLQNISSTGEANKIVQTDNNGVANVSISGSAAALNGIYVNLSGITDGQVLIYNATTKNLVPSTNISGSAKKIDGVGINLADLENGKAIAYDKTNKMFVADKHEFLSAADVSDSGEVGKIVKLGTDKIIHADIDGSAEKIDGIDVNVTGIKDSQVLAYDIISKTLKPVNKDYFNEKSVSETGEIGKLIRLGSDKTVHANISGSAAKLDGIAADLSGIKNNQILGYDSAAKEIVPKDIDAEKICGITFDTSTLQNNQVMIYNATKNKFVPADKDYITEEKISTTGEVGKLIRLSSDGIINASISGSANEIEGVKVYASSANDGEILVYHASTNSYEPEPKNSAGAGKFLVLKKGDEILLEYNGAESKELDIAPLTEVIEEAEKLSTPRKIILTGKAEGEATFDGTADAEINVTAIKISSVDSANKSATADKLLTPRKISIGGKVTASPIEFDGSSDVVLTVTAVEVDEQESVEKLKTPRKISVTGDAEGVFYFDGSEDVTLQLEVLKAAAVTGTAENAAWASQAGTANYAAASAEALQAVQDYNGDAIHETYLKISDAEENFVKKSELAALIAELNS